MQVIKLTWLIVDHTPLGADTSQCDFLCAHVLSPLLQEMVTTRLRIGLALSEALILFLQEEEPKLLQIISELIDKNSIELVISLPYPFLELESAVCHRHIDRLQSLYKQIFGIQSSCVIPFGLNFEATALSLLAEHKIERIVLNRCAMQSTCRFISFRKVRMSALGVDDQLSKLSEETSLRAFFIRIRDLAKENDQNVTFITRLHHIGLERGSYERCWKKGLFKKMMQGMSQSQKWLHTQLPKSVEPQEAGYPVEGMFPLGVEEPQNWKRLAFQNLQCLSLWTELQWAQYSLRDLEDVELLTQAQEAQLLFPYPLGKLEHAHLRHEAWKILSVLGHKSLSRVLEQEDRDGDGVEELYIDCGWAKITCVPRFGGGLVKLLLPLIGNLINVITRQPQQWHQQIACDPTLPSLPEDSYSENLIVPQDPYFYSKLGYDKHHRMLFSERIFTKGLRLKSLRTGQAHVLCELSQHRFKVQSIEEDEERISIDLEGYIVIQTQRGERSLSIQKYYHF